MAARFARSARFGCPGYTRVVSAGRAGVVAFRSARATGPAWAARVMTAWATRLVPTRPVAAGSAVATTGPKFPGTPGPPGKLGPGPPGSAGGRIVGGR